MENTTRFCVFANDKPADCHHAKVDKSWDNSEFASLEEALEYADNWLGAYSPGVHHLRLEAYGKPYDYDGYGDTIEIRTRF